MSNQRSFSIEFKRQIVEELLSGESRPAQICRRYNIQSSLILTIASKEQSVVAHQFQSLIDHKVKRVFYTQQYWEEPDLETRYGVVGGLTDYQFPPHWRRHYLRNSTFSERYFEAAFSIDQ